MTDPFAILAVAGAAFVLAGFVKGVLGQGLPTVAVGILSLIMSPGEATALLIVPALLTNVWQAWAGPSFGALSRRLWPAIAAICVGTWIAAMIGLDLSQSSGRMITFGRGPQGCLTFFRDRSQAGLSPGFERREFGAQFLRPRAKVPDVLFIQLYLLLPAAHLEFLRVDRLSRPCGSRFVFG